MSTSGPLQGPLQGPAQGPVLGAYVNAPNTDDSPDVQGKGSQSGSGTGPNVNYGRYRTQVLGRNDGSVFKNQQNGLSEPPEQGCLDRIIIILDAKNVIATKMNDELCGIMINKSNDVMAANKQIIEEQKAQIDYCMGIMNGARNSLGESERKRSVQGERIKTLSSECEKKDNDIIGLQSQIDTNAGINKELDVLKNQLCGSRGKVSQLQTEMGNIESQLGQKVQEISELQKESHTLKTTGEIQQGDDGHSTDAGLEVSLLAQTEVQETGDIEAKPEARKANLEQTTGKDNDNQDQTETVSQAKVEVDSEVMQCGKNSNQSAMTPQEQVFIPRMPGIDVEGVSNIDQKQLEVVSVSANGRSESVGNISDVDEDTGSDNTTVDSSDEAEEIEGEGEATTALGGADGKKLGAGQ